MLAIKCHITRKYSGRRILLKARRNGFEGELMVQLRNEREGMFFS